MFSKVTINFSLFHSVEICKFFPYDVLRKICQIKTFSLKSYTVNQFDEKFLQHCGLRGNFRVFPSLRFYVKANFRESKW